MTAIEALLADDTLRRMRTGAEITKVAAVPPSSASVALDRGTLLAHGVFGFEHLDVRAHSFVLLRSQIISRFYRPGGRVLAVTSTQPGNGKTYVTANLAAALSRIHPTVLIDLDLRRSTLAGRLGLTPTLGIDDFLAGDASWQDVRTPIAAVDLSVFGVRQPRQNSASLLANGRLGRMLDAMRTLPDAPICIVDTPPILALDDIMLISQSVDGVLMVIEEGNTRSEDLANALRILSPTPVVGSVLNKSITAAPASSGYGDYYSAP